MAKFIPFPAFYDDVPIDLRFLFAEEKPAGKRGFLKVDGDGFVFEDGTPARFWGTNFNGAACFPSHEYAHVVARRLAKIGCNIVRMHQLDAEWNCPNLFAISRGKRVKNTQEFDPESMDRLDYLIYALKQEGIYVYLDMLTYRNFKSGDGFENAKQLGDTSRQPYAATSPRMVELQKDFMSRIWNHMNPYTQCAYKDEPAIVMTEIINEWDLFHFSDFKLEPYTSHFRALYRDYLRMNGLEDNWQDCDLKDNTGHLSAFKEKIMRDYFAEMYAYMRSLGVKIPITGTNFDINDQLVRSMSNMDFMDSHFYFYDWRWDDHVSWKKSLTDGSSTMLEFMVRNRIAGKPFFISEWDMPWPNPCRMESAVFYAAVGSFQGWSGFTIHTYAYGTRLNEMNILGKEIWAPSINGVGYREGIFSTWNDPAKFGLFFHSALITRRNDLASIEPITIIHAGDNNMAAYMAAAELRPVGVSFEEGLANNEPLLDLNKGEVRSIDGQLYRNWNKHYGYVNSPRTKAVYGRLAENGKISMDGLTVKSSNPQAIVVMSSLSDACLKETDNILLTALGDSVNTDAKWDGDYMLEYGKPPILVEVAEADIILENVQSEMKVWSISPEGYYNGEIPSIYKDGKLSFHIGNTFPSMYYMITME